MEEAVGAPVSYSLGVGFLFLLLVLLGLIVGAVFFIRWLSRRGREPNPASDKEDAARATGETALQAKQDQPLNIFISYRRSDSSDVCGRLYDRLVAEFGQTHVFRDVDSINPGYDFQDIIDRHIDKSDVGLVLIGPDWAGFEGGDVARLQRGEDFVRIEVAALLKKGIPVIPVLVRGAKVPPAETFPEDLSPLVRRNFSQLRPDPDFNIDVDRLLSALERIKAD
ncbi:MAG: toll/interleukin-1 receptor domain-containing protein [Pseudomonadota bacterium]